MNDTHRTQAYGNETNPLVGGHPDLQGRVDWTDPRLARVTRLRLLTDAGFPLWDVSYCYGVLHDGTHVEVSLPFNQVPRRGAARFIVGLAIKYGVHAKRLGILDGISKLW